MRQQPTLGIEAVFCVMLVAMETDSHECARKRTHAHPSLSHPGESVLRGRGKDLVDGRDSAGGSALEFELEDRLKSFVASSAKPPE